jgi:hypothetical protein
MGALLFVLLFGTTPQGDRSPAVRWNAGQSATQAPTARAGPETAVVRDYTRDGVHWRLMTPNGPIHVFRPRGYSPATAGTIIYVHGYFTDADEAWEQHRLQEQFREARQNALFIVPEAPVSNADTVKWEDVSELLIEVRRMTRMKLPDGPLIAVGHSGAFRTLAPWLASRRVDQIILLDGFYQSPDDFKAWLVSHPRARSHRLILVGYETADRCEQFAQGFRNAVVRQEIPTSARRFTYAERHARLLYLKSQFGHMEMVAEGQVLPVLLRLTPLPSL